MKRRLGTAKEACKIAGVTSGTLRYWLSKGRISAERWANGRYRYDLDSVAAMRVEYPCTAVDERIRELIDGAPEFTDEQISAIRLLLHTAGNGDGTG